MSTSAYSFPRCNRQISYASLNRQSCTLLPGVLAVHSSSLLPLLRSLLLPAAAVLSQPCIAICMLGVLRLHIWFTDAEFLGDCSARRLAKNAATRKLSSKHGSSDPLTKARLCFSSAESAGEMPRLREQPV